MTTAKEALKEQSKTIEKLSKQLATLDTKIKKLSNKKQVDQKLTSKINDIETKFHKISELLKIDIDDLEVYL